MNGAAVSLSPTSRGHNHNRCGITALSDTNPLDGGEEGAFSAALKRRGVDAFVVPVERSDWIKVASAIVTLDFWKGTCRPDGPAYKWYLEKVSEETGRGRVVLIIVLGSTFKSIDPRIPSMPGRSTSGVRRERGVVLALLLIRCRRRSS